MRATALRYFECLNAEDWEGMPAMIWHEQRELRRTADGREIIFDAVDVFQMASGRIVRLRLRNGYDISYAGVRWLRPMPSHPMAVATEWVAVGESRHGRDLLPADSRCRCAQF